MSNRSRYPIVKPIGLLRALVSALVTVMLVACTAQGAELEMATKEGFAATEDGVRIHYRLLGPSHAPTLWVGYPWTNPRKDVHRELIKTLAAKYQVLYVDYPRGTGESTGPLPGDLKAETVAKDYVTVADAAGVDRFVAMGYSWGAGFGIHVASRTKRCAGLAIGGWPVLDAPYSEFLEGLRSGTSRLPAWTTTEKIRRSSITFYAEIVSSDWDEEAAVEFMSDRAGLLYLYVGSEDVGVPSVGLGVPTAERIIATRERLEAAGWEVDIIEGHDHTNLPLDAWLPGVLDFLDGKTW